MLCAALLANDWSTFVGACFGQRTVDPAVDAYNLAVGLYKQQRWALAAETFRKFVKEHPGHVKVAAAKLYLGLTLINLREYREAREVLRQYVADYPSSRELPHAMYRVAECSYFLDDLKAAERELRAFLKKSPKDPLAEYAYPYLADTQLRLGKPAEALASFRRGLEVAPKGKLADDCRFGMARALEALGRPADARKVYRQIASDRSSGRAAEALFRLATLAFDAGELADAAREFDRLEEFFPTSALVPSARLNAGYAYYRLKDYATAAARFQKARQSPNQAVVAGYWLALSLKSQKKYDEALAVLTSLDVGRATPDVAEGITFQTADCQLRRGHYLDAAKGFQRAAEKWPKGEFADDSFLFAAEAWLLAGDVQKAQAILEAFPKRFPNSPLRLYQRLLQGRCLAATGQVEAQQKALDLFRTVASQSRIPRTRALARMHWARALLKLQRPQEVADVLGPLLQELRKDDRLGADFQEAWILQADAYLAASQFAEAARTAAEFIERSPASPHWRQAQIVHALASAHLRRYDEVRKDLDQLIARFPTAAAVWQTAFQAAELAYDQKDWRWAEVFFAKVIEGGEKLPEYPAALSGLAWSLYGQEKYAEAAKRFAEMLKRFPKHELAAEAAYMQGIALRASGDLKAAAQTLQRAAQAYSGRWEAYEAAREAARTLKQLGRIQDADGAYQKAHAELLKQPEDKRRRLDALLDEWALLNYEAQRFQRADEIFRLLLEEVPQSPLADAARYSLAESDLLAGRLNAAKKAFEELAAKTNSDVRQDSLYRLVQIAAEEKNWKNVTKYASLLQRQFPKGRYYWEAAFQLGQAQLQQKRPDEAVRTLEPLLDQRNNHKVRDTLWYPHAWVLLAEAYFQQKQYQKVAGRGFHQRLPRLALPLPDGRRAGTSLQATG